MPNVSAFRPTGWRIRRHEPLSTLGVTCSSRRNLRFEDHQWMVPFFYPFFHSKSVSSLAVQSICAGLSKLYSRSTDPCTTSRYCTAFPQRNTIKWESESLIKMYLLRRRPFLNYEQKFFQLLLPVSWSNKQYETTHRGRCDVLIPNRNVTQNISQKYMDFTINPLRRFPFATSWSTAWHTAWHSCSEYQNLTVEWGLVRRSP